MFAVHEFLSGVALVRMVEIVDDDVADGVVQDDAKDEMVLVLV